MTPLVLLVITMLGNNHAELRNAGIQVSVSPVVFRSMEECERDRDAVLGRVAAWTKKLETEEPDLGEGMISVTGKCEAVDRKTGKLR